MIRFMKSERKLVTLRSLPKGSCYQLPGSDHVFMIIDRSCGEHRCSLDLKTGTFETIQQHDFHVYPVTVAAKIEETP